MGGNRMRPASALLHLQALGMRVPEGLTPDHIASAVGSQERVPVLDVASQTSGPRPTLAEWARYFRSRPKERLLNVVSLSLAGTPLQVLHWADRSLASAILSQTTPAILARACRRLMQV